MSTNIYATQQRNKSRHIYTPVDCSPLPANRCSQAYISGKTSPGVAFLVERSKRNRALLFSARSLALFSGILVCLQKHDYLFEKEAAQGSIVLTVSVAGVGSGTVLLLGNGWAWQKQPLAR